MDRQQHQDTENTAARRPAATLSRAEAPFPLAEAIMVLGVLLIALGSGWMLYGPFLRQMFQVMLHSIFGGR
jgi:uncharacterized RDD family membrane protein YckC